MKDKGSIKLSPQTEVFESQDIKNQMCSVSLILDVNIEIGRLGKSMTMKIEFERISYTNNCMVVTRIDTPKYGETLKFMYIKYQPTLVVLPKVYQV